MKQAICDQAKNGVKKQTMAWSTKWTPQGSDHSAHSHLE